jgi:hypothetical protein
MLVNDLMIQVKNSLARAFCLLRPVIGLSYNIMVCLQIFHTVLDFRYIQEFKMKRCSRPTRRRQRTPPRDKAREFIDSEHDPQGFEMRYINKDIGKFCSHFYACTGLIQLTWREKLVAVSPINNISLGGRDFQI